MVVTLTGGMCIFHIVTYEWSCLHNLCEFYICFCFVLVFFLYLFVYFYPKEIGFCQLCEYGKVSFTPS